MTINPMINAIVEYMAIRVWMGCVMALIAATDFVDGLMRVELLLGEFQRRRAPQSQVAPGRPNRAL